MCCWIGQLWKIPSVCTEQKSSVCSVSYLHFAIHYTPNYGKNWKHFNYIACSTMHCWNWWIICEWPADISNRFQAENAERIRWTWETVVHDLLTTNSLWHNDNVIGWRSVDEVMRHSHSNSKLSLKMSHQFRTQWEESSSSRSSKKGTNEKSESFLCQVVSLISQRTNRKQWNFLTFFLCINVYGTGIKQKTRSVTWRK